MDVALDISMLVNSIRKENNWVTSYASLLCGSMANLRPNLLRLLKSRRKLPILIFYLLLKLLSLLNELSEYWVVVAHVCLVLFHLKLLDSGILLAFR